jgi:hypothetical protein
MLESGTALSDSRVIKLNKKLTAHAMSVVILEKAYENKILS